MSTTLDADRSVRPAPLGPPPTARAVDWRRLRSPIAATALVACAVAAIGTSLGTLVAGHLAEHASTVTDPGELARRIRVHLAPAIVQQIYGPTKELDVIALDPELERLVTQALTSPHGAALDPGVADTLSKSAADNARRQEDLGVPACLLVPDMIRAPMARLLKRSAPRLKVLGHSEIPETHSIRIGSIIGSTT